MQWLTDLVALVGTQGAYTNALRSLAEEREVASHMERFLLRFDHPAGQALVPVEPPAGDCSEVA